jgi:hypothetical protein
MSDQVMDKVVESLDRIQFDDTPSLLATIDWTPFAWLLERITRFIQDESLYEHILRQRFGGEDASVALDWGQTGSRWSKLKSLCCAWSSIFIFLPDLLPPQVEKKCLSFSHAAAARIVSTL